jgi:hypothetical protein
MAEGYYALLGFEREVLCEMYFAFIGIEKLMK